VHFPNSDYIIDPACYDSSAVLAYNHETGYAVGMVAKLSSCKDWTSNWIPYLDNYILLPIRWIDESYIYLDADYCMDHISIMDH
jgi:hypothetical protein